MDGSYGTGRVVRQGRRLRIPQQGRGSVGSAERRNHGRGRRDRSAVREGIGMESGRESVTRTVAIDGAFLGEVLLYLRRDARTPVLRWTLGDRGTAEIDACFDTCDSGWKT